MTESESQRIKSDAKAEPDAPAPPDAEEKAIDADASEVDAKRARIDEAFGDDEGKSGIESEADEKKDKKDGEEEDDVDFLPRGNPLRPRRGIIAILAGAIPAALLMAKNGQSGSFNSSRSPASIHLVAQAVYFEL